jgi:hypothetical protein
MWSFTYDSLMNSVSWTGYNHDNQPWCTDLNSLWSVAWFNGMYICICMVCYIFTYYIYLDMFACSGPAGGRLYSKYYMGSPARTWLPGKCMTMRPSLAKSYLNQEPTEKKIFLFWHHLYTPCYHGSLEVVVHCRGQRSGSVLYWQPVCWSDQPMSLLS